MANSCTLSLPRDIPWKRICVSEDMLDAVACDHSLPPKWHSSLAVFRYDPPDEYQEHEGYRISYLKVAATITGYQPHDKEIEGRLDLSGLTLEDIEDVEQLLGEYQPCTGAILQVSVSPKDQSLNGPEDSPFFLDFEPKRRSLYETATDTNERTSRSLETLNVSKSGGSTQSLEVLDVDMGGSVSMGIQGSAAGVGGGGLQASQSSQGQWGTKSLGMEGHSNIYTTDQSREKRETQAFTTQLSQLYHLFDSYHLGTNRAVFFVQPRPHVLEEPSGFVRGPRPVEGIQEIFLVVARPEDQEDFCVAARLDTAHLTEVELFEHDHRAEIVSCSVSAPAPQRSKDLIGPYAAEAQEEPDLTIPLTAFGSDAGERIYKCHSITRTETVTFTPPFSDFRIDPDNPYEITDESASHGSHTITLSSDGESLAVTCTAKSNYCYNYGGDFCFSCPAYIASWDAHARVTLQVNMVSREAMRHVGNQKYLLVTTRGVCCGCQPEPSLPAGVIVVTPVDLVIRRLGDRFGLRLEDLHEAMPELDKKPGKRMPAATANALGDLIASELRQATARPGAYEKVQGYLETDFFVRRLMALRRRRPGIHDWFATPFTELGELPDSKSTESYFGKPAAKVLRRDIIARPARKLSEGLGISVREATRLRMQAMGLRIRDKEAGRKQA